MCKQHKINRSNKKVIKHKHLQKNKQTTKKQQKKIKKHRSLDDEKFLDIGQLWMQVGLMGAAGGFAYKKIRQKKYLQHFRALQLSYDQQKGQNIFLQQQQFQLAGLVSNLKKLQSKLTFQGNQMNDKLQDIKERFVE